MNKKVRDAEWFAQKLRERGVCGLEIAWGDYRAHFQEIPKDALDRYLSYRPKLLHKQALEVVLFEDRMLSNHPFMQE